MIQKLKLTFRIPNEHFPFLALPTRSMQIHVKIDFHFSIHHLPIVPRISSSNADRCKARCSY